MNVCMLSGHLVRNAVLKGKDKKVLLFTLATHYGYDRETEDKERTAYVPCVVFNPKPELEHTLVTQGKGLLLGLEGRIVSSSYETQGERKFSTEVVAFNTTVVIMKS